jgi:mRNA interferase HigB
MGSLCHKLSVRIISTATLKSFYLQPTYRQAEQPIKVWVAVTKAASWNNPPDVKKSFNSADILKNNRVVFDLGGNKYRLIAKISFAVGIVYVRFIGTHTQYDKIDADSI